MINLSSAVIEQKNDLSSTESILILLELDIPSLSEKIKLVRNNEDVLWNGSNWQSFPFDLDEISEASAGEIPQLSIRIANASRVIEKYLTDYDQWLKLNFHKQIIATIYLIATSDIANNSPIKSYEFEVSSFYTNAREAVFNLTQKNIYAMQFPNNRITRKCRFKFGSVECGLNVLDGQSCNKTLSDCRRFNNSIRFGGFPSVGGKMDKTIND